MKEEHLTCPFCGHKINKPYKYIVEKKVVDKRRYLVTYKCPYCGKYISLVKERAKKKYIGGKNEPDFHITLLPVAEKASIIVKQKKDGHTEYVEHNIITKKGDTNHIGIKGKKGWQNNKVQFKTKKGKTTEFTEKDRGAKTQRWKKR